MDQPTPNAPNSNQPAFPAARLKPDTDHSAGGTMDIDFALVATCAAFSVMLVTTIVLLTQAWFSHEVQIERFSAYKSAVNPELEALREKQLANIKDYRWLDGNHQNVTLPIDRAMELTLLRLQKQTAEQKNDSQTKDNVNTK